MISVILKSTEETIETACSNFEQCVCPGNCYRSGNKAEYIINADLPTIYQWINEAKKSGIILDAWIFLEGKDEVTVARQKFYAISTAWQGHVTTCPTCLGGHRPQCAIFALIDTTLSQATKAKLEAEVTMIQGNEGKP